MRSLLRLPSRCSSTGPLAVAPDFRLRDHADDVADLCRFLDGLPLAIELAAANARLLTPGQIRSALEGDLGLLAAHTSDLPERQQTLSATIEWSYDRLDPAARTVADRLALFERGFTVEAVEAVCDDVPDVLGCAGPDRRGTFDPPGQLTRRGSVRRARHRPGVCTDPPSSTRTTSRRARSRWPTIYVARARAWAGQLNGPEGPTVVGRYDDTAADLDAVLDWASATGRTDLAVELATTITDLWIASGRLTDGLRRSQRLLESRWSLARAPGRAAPHRRKAGLSPDELGPGGHRAAGSARAARRRPDHRDCDPLLPRCRARRDRVGRRGRHAGIGGAGGGRAPRRLPGGRDRAVRAGHRSSHGGRRGGRAIVLRAPARGRLRAR